MIEIISNQLYTLKDIIRSSWDNLSWVMGSSGILGSALQMGMPSIRENTVYFGSITIYVNILEVNFDIVASRFTSLCQIIMTDSFRR